MLRHRVLAATLIGLVVLLAAPLHAGYWPAWRGPAGSGLALDDTAPLHWSTDENVRWRAPLPGPGQSSPIVWNDHVFVSCAEQHGRLRTLICFNRADGSVRWRAEVPFDRDEPNFQDLPYCNATPATDSERVVVSHGSAGVFCYNMEGVPLWSRDLGSFDHQWNNASSPVLHDGNVILYCGPGSRSFLTALDLETGNTIWQHDEGQGDPNAFYGTWSTPLVLEVDARPQIVMSYPGLLKGHDPATGQELWRCDGLGDLVYTSPIAGDGVAVAMSGYHGPYMAVRLGGSGNVTETHRLWRHDNPQPQRIGSGIVLDGHIYLLNEDGTFECMSLDTGETVSEERLGTQRSWSSLVLAGGRFYATDWDGTVFVVAASPDLQILAENQLGEMTRASPAVSDGQIFIRTYEHLYCIGESTR